MNTADPAKQTLWNEIDVKEEWVGLPGKKPNPLAKALKDNLILLEICILSFAIGVVPGYIMFDESSAMMNPIIENIKNEIGLDRSGFNLAVKIFFNNTRASLIMLVSGTLLFVPLLILMVNGFFMGFVLKAFLNKGHSILAFILGILPHGIFELPAIFLSAALGIRIGLSYILPKNNRIIEVSNSIKTAARVYAMLVLPLLLLSAFIEAYISIMLIS